MELRRRVPFSFKSLSIYIHRYTRLKFHSEPVLVDGDLFNQLPDKRFVVFGQGGGLFLQEGAHAGDTHLKKPNKNTLSAYRKQGILRILRICKIPEPLVKRLL